MAHNNRGFLASCFARTCEQVDSVNLWLGANVMMEFSFDEADNLLSGNLETGV
jgi:hypothetical protein